MISLNNIGPQGVADPKKDNPDKGLTIFAMLLLFDFEDRRQPAIGSKVKCDEMIKVAVQLPMLGPRRPSPTHITPNSTEIMPHAGPEYQVVPGAVNLYRNYL